MKMMQWLGAFAVLAILTFVSVSAHAPSGAIFTTLPDGTAVNYNIYGSKLDVYLDGGPGQNAPIGAAGSTTATTCFK